MKFRDHKFPSVLSLFSSSKQKSTERSSSQIMESICSYCCLLQNKTVHKEAPHRSWNPSAATAAFFKTKQYTKKLLTDHGIHHPLFLHHPINNSHFSSQRKNPRKITG
jgi:hypothetical protein